MKNVPQNPARHPRENATKKSTPRAHRFTVYMSTLERRALREFAASLGIDMSTCVRRSLAEMMRGIQLSQPKKKGLWCLVIDNDRPSDSR